MQYLTCARTIIAAVTALASLSCGAIQLLERDITGDGRADALYDPDRNITWLRDANPIGYGNWYIATAWAEGLSVGQYSDWRLPNGNDGCTGFYCTRSELGHLWYESLGNGIEGSNYGDFINFGPGLYWSSFDGGARPSEAWVFAMGSGRQINIAKTDGAFTLVVRDGDVISSTVPEASTIALWLLGLALLALGSRRTTSIAANVQNIA